MPISVRWVSAYCLIFIAVLPFAVFSQQQQKEIKHSLYGSWGYNTEWYTKSNVRVSQPALGNDYVFENISGHDHRGWDYHILHKNISIPQYNYRLGYFFNEKQGLALELNFDHTKFIFADDQMAHIKGTLGNRAVDSTLLFSEGNGFYYHLNNGANFFLINIVKRSKWLHNKEETISIETLVKAGIGPVVPHVDNSFFGKANKQHFQLGGWNTGIEAAVRITFLKYVYLDYANKLDYARYSGLRIYEGTVRHAFGTYEMVLNLGVTFPVGSKEKK